MGYVTFKCLFNLYWILLLWKKKERSGVEGGRGGEGVRGGGVGKSFLHNICCIEYIHVDVLNGCV